MTVNLSFAIHVFCSTAAALPAASLHFALKMPKLNVQGVNTIHRLIFILVRFN